MNDQWLHEILSFAVDLTPILSVFFGEQQLFLEFGSEKQSEFQLGCVSVGFCSQSRDEELGGSGAGAEGLNLPRSQGCSFTSAEMNGTPSAPLMCCQLELGKS